MKFNDLEWSAFCFFYRSVEDKNYVRVMADVPFLRELRNSPAGINLREFEEKVILNLIKIENYDLLLKRNLAAQLLAAIVELQPELSLLRDASILNCDLFEDAIVNSINNAYRTLCAIPGLWSTGATKVLHVLNDRLFAVLDQHLAAHLKLIPREGELVPLIRVVQGEAMEVVKDFKRHKFAGSPETFLSDELGYTKHGCRKSLVKFIDEYYWLTLVDELPIPPRWQPQIEPAQNKSSTV